MPLPTSRNRLDADAAAYIARSGATDRAAINAFVRGVKALGLWNNMVCWPMRSSQNAGNGDTVYSLGGLGTFNGTLVNGPAWTADGITFGGNTQQIQYSPQFSLDLTKGGYSVHAVWSGMSVPVAFSEGVFHLLSHLDAPFALGNAITTGVFGGASWFPQSRNYNGNRYYANRVSNLSISGNVGYGWNAETLTLQTNGVDEPMVAIVSSTASNGLYTLRTAGRNNATQAQTSRVSYLMAFPPSVGMTSATLTSIYNLAKQTLGQGLGLP